MKLENVNNFCIRIHSKYFAEIIKRISLIVNGFYIIFLNITLGYF